MPIVVKKKLKTIITLEYPVSFGSWADAIENVKTKEEKKQTHQVLEAIHAHNCDYPVPLDFDRFLKYTPKKNVKKFLCNFINYISGNY